MAVSVFVSVAVAVSVSVSVAIIIIIISIVTTIAIVIIIVVAARGGAEGPAGPGASCSLFFRTLPAAGRQTRAVPGTSGGPAAGGSYPIITFHTDYSYGASFGQ